MKIKALLVTLLLAVCGTANAAITFVQKAAQTYSAATVPVSLSSVGAGHLLVLFVNSTSTSAPTSVTESLSETVSVAVPYGGNSAHGNYMAIYYVQNTAGGATVTFTVNFSAGVSGSVVAAEYAGAATSGVFDSATAIATGNNTSTFSTASITPATSGELFVSATNYGSNTTPTWNSPFTIQQTATGNTVFMSYADDQSVSAATSASGTFSFNLNWAAAMAAFKPAAGGGSCTHSGITSAGAIAIPNGTSGSYQGKSGAFVTPDCSTISYRQPTVGNFGVN